MLFTLRNMSLKYGTTTISQLGFLCGLTVRVAIQAQGTFLRNPHVKHLLGSLPLSSIFDYLGSNNLIRKGNGLGNLGAYGTIACIKKCMHNFAQFRFNWQPIQRSLGTKWAWRPNCPLTLEKRWSPLILPTLHWPNAVTNLAMSHAVACICRLIAIFCLHCFFFIVF